MNKLAQNLSSQGRFIEADKLFAAAFDVSAKSLPPDHFDVANMLHDRAQNFNAMKQYAEAERLLVKALEIRQKHLPPNHPSIAHALSDLASVILSQGRAEEALERIRAGVAILLSRGKLDELGRQRFQEFVKIAWRVNELRKRSPATKALLDEALTSGQRATATLTSAAVSQMAARFAAHDDKLNQLIRRRDDTEAEQARLERDLSSALAIPVGKRAVPVDAIRAQLADAAGRLAKTDRELKEQFPKYFGLINPEPLGIDRIQQLLGPDEVLVDFMSGFDEVYVWAVAKDAVEWQRLAIEPAALSKDVAQLRAALDLQTISAAGAKAELFDLGLAHELYAKLFGAIEPIIAGKSNLIVVANGPLTSLPVQLLVKTPPAIPRPSLSQLNAYKDADWIVRHHAVSVLPSVTSLSAIREVAGKPKGHSPLIGFANPVLGGQEVASVDDAVRGLKIQDSSAVTAKKTPVTSAAGGYSAFWRGPAADLNALRAGLQQLPETEKELKAVAQNLKASDADLKLGEAATETAVKQAALSDYNIVYFATHGLVAGEIQGLGEPALVFSLPRSPSDIDDGLLTASEVTQLNLDADWVVLSACNTAAGEGPGAEALSGLARAFFHAGARAMLVSHWRVGSEAAAALTTTTFDILQREPEVGRAEAVRRAMVALLDDPHDAWNAYPAFWAPFSVVGEGKK
jgi:CHAT domain-containing protein